jgi:hypothetical protein
MATVSGFSKTLVVAVESLKVGEFDNDEVESKFLLSPHSSTTAGKLSSGKGKSGAKSRRKQSEEVYECDFEEDIIDGFAIVGFNSLEDLEVGYFRLVLAALKYSAYCISDDIQEQLCYNSYEHLMTYRHQVTRKA